MRGGNAKGRELGKGKEVLPPEEGEDKGGLLIPYLWTQVISSIHSMRVVNTEAIYYQSKTPEMCLETADQEKNNKYLNS